MISQTFLSTAVGLLASSTFFYNVAAQVSTQCQPLNTTCPADPAFGMDYNFQFNQTVNPNLWETTVGPVKYDANTGAAFTVAKQGDSPTIRTKFYFFFGRVELWMKAAPGTGIISSVMLLSDDLDEIDWEFMGGDPGQAETNYFGKGQQDFHNAIYHPVDGGVQNDYHNYTMVWTKDALDFYIDTKKTRTLLPKDANNTLYYPQTPMRLSIGIWAGGDPRLAEGTRQWAGGDTDYSKGPFTMFVKNAHITDYSSGSEYTYGDKSGSWQSIQVKSGNSTAKETIEQVPAPSVSDRWNALPSTARTGIIAGAIGGAALLAIIAVVYCIRQRRRGAREAKFAQIKADQEAQEIADMRKAGIDPDSFREEAAEYNPKAMAHESVTQLDTFHTNQAAVGQPTSAAALGAGAAIVRPGMTSMGSSEAKSPMPLLREDQYSPRLASPGPNQGPYSDRNMHNASPMGMRSPPAAMGFDRTPSPGMHQQQQQRSFTSPDPHMRMGSPGPGQGGYGDQQRVASPGPIPQRSFTGDGYPQHPNNAAPNYHNGQDQGYWGGNNYR